MSSTRNSATAVVIGGGIAGLMSALELSRAGFAVTVLERCALARQSSWAGGGLLSPLYPWQVPPTVWALSAASMVDYPALCAMLAAETGIDPEWTPSGLWMLDASEIDTGLGWCAAQGLAAERIEASRGLAHPQAGLYLPWTAQVRNPRLCRALAVHLVQRGVRLCEQLGPVRLQPQAGCASALAAGATWSADVVVVAAGAWSGALLAEVAWPLPVRPMKGEMLLLQGAPGVLPQLMVQGGRYLIPRRDGCVLVGSTVEDAGFDATPSAEALQSLRTFADSLYPACARMSLEAHWAGLRPGSPDGIPIIQRHPEIRNLYANTGHHRYGLTMAPASAKKLVSLVASEG